MKIKVLKTGEYAVQFDMVGDSLLPETGEFHLVPVGKEYLFVAEHVESRTRELREIDLKISNLNRERKGLEALCEQVHVRMGQIESQIRGAKFHEHQKI